MTDRELLELAAKAASIDVEYLDKRGFEGRRDAPKAFYHRIGIHEWNPLTDDGDALRLAVKLSIFNGADFYKFRMHERIGNQGKDDCYATRRSIVRAAAEIGKSIP